MKKIFSLIAVLAGVMSFTSCSSDDTENPYAHVSTVVVKSADVEYKSVGGTGTIVVESASPITVSTTSDWVSTSISGNTISVTAAPTTELDGRSAQLVIRNSADSTTVAIVQHGLVFRVDTGNLTCDDKENTLTVDARSDIDITVQSLADWMTASYDAETGAVKVQVAANETGMGRVGQVQVTSDRYSETFEVKQIEFEKDVLGDYDFYFSRSATQAQWAALSATLTEDALTLSVSGLEFKIPVTFPNGANAPFVVRVGDEQYTGPYQSYYTYLAFDAADYSLLTQYPQYFFGYLGGSYSEAELDLEDYDGETYFTGIFDGVIYLDGDPLASMTTWYLLAMTGQEYSADNLLGSLLTMHYPQMEKVPAAADEAAAARRASRRQAETLKYIMAPAN